MRLRSSNHLACPTQRAKWGSFRLRHPGVRRGLPFFSMLVLLLVAADCRKANSPNVIFVIWDTTRVDHLTPYGYARDTTPNLSLISENAIVFENSFSAAPWTVPSVAGLFTSLYSHNHRVSFEAKKNASLSLPESAVTLAEAMKAAGYVTALFTAQGIFLRNQGGGFVQGFDNYEKLGEKKLVPKTLEFIDDLGSQPFFVVVYWTNPHAPYTPGAEHDKWSVKDMSPVNIEGHNGSNREGFYSQLDVNRGRVSLTDAQWAQLEALYDGELNQNDKALGQLWSELKKRGIADTSLFIFTSDHGEGFNEHPRARTWHSLPYETILHVPMLIRYPGVLPAGRIKSVVRTLDLYPTIMELIGKPVLHSINGESLLPLIGAERKDRPLVGASHFENGVIFYRARGYKLFYSRRNNPQPEVYHLETDPQELDNLAQRMPGLLHQLKTELETFMQTTSIELPGAGDTLITEQEVKRLRALGYVQ